MFGTLHMDRLLSDLGKLFTSPEISFIPSQPEVPQTTGAAFPVWGELLGRARSRDCIHFLSDVGVRT